MTAAATGAGEAARSSSDIIRAGSKSFAAASMLFTPELRQSVHQLYAWCRHCDDVIDGQDLGFASAAAVRSAPDHELALLREKTADALAGRPTSDPVFQGFQHVMSRHRIAGAHAYALLDGFAMDVEGRTYLTADDTLTYCYHVAGVVGVMMATIMGVSDDDTLDRASDLGIGFQLTNIARDLVEDAHADRCYIPQSWLSEAGLSRGSMGAPGKRQDLATLASRLVQTADDYYASSRAGMARLPLRSCWAVGTARSVYRKIGMEVVKRGPDAWTRRVSTSPMQKLASLLAGGATAIDASTRGRLITPSPRTGLWTRPRV